MSKFDKAQIGNLQTSILKEEAKLTKKTARELPNEFYDALYNIGEDEKLKTEQIVIRLQSVQKQMEFINRIDLIHIATEEELNTLIASVVGYIRGSLTNQDSLGKKIELLEDVLAKRDKEFKAVFSKEFDDEFSKRLAPWDARKKKLNAEWNSIQSSLPPEANIEWEKTGIRVYFKDISEQDNPALDAAEALLNRWKTLEQRRDLWKARKNELVAEWDEIKSSVPDDVTFILAEQTFQNKEKEDKNSLAEAAATLGYWQERLELENRWEQARKDGYFTQEDEKRFKEALKNGESAKDNGKAEKIVGSKEAWNKNDRRIELIAVWKELVVEAEDAEVNYSLRKNEFERIIRLDSLSDQYAYIQVGNTELYTAKKKEFDIKPTRTVSDRENHQVCSAVVLDLTENVIDSMRSHIEKSKTETIEREITEKAKAEAERQQAEKEKVEREKAEIENARQRKLSQRSSELNEKLDGIYSKVQKCHGDLVIKLSTLKSKIQDDKTLNGDLKEVQKREVELSDLAKKIKEAETLSGKTDEDIAKKQAVIAEFNVTQFDKSEAEINEKINKIESDYRKKLEEDLAVSKAGTEDILKQCVDIINDAKEKVRTVESKVTKIQLMIQGEEKLQYLAPTEDEKRLTGSVLERLRSEVADIQRELKYANSIKEVEVSKLKLNGKLDAIVETREQIKKVSKPVADKYKNMLSEKQQLLKRDEEQLNKKQKESVTLAKQAVTTLETEGTKRLEKYHWWSFYSYTQQKRTKMSELQTAIIELKAAVELSSKPGASVDQSKLAGLMKKVNDKLAAFKNYTKNQPTENEKVYFKTVDAAVQALAGETTGAINRMDEHSRALKRTQQALDETQEASSSLSM